MQTINGTRTSGDLSCAKKKVRKRRSGATNAVHYKRATVRWRREDVQGAADVADLLGVTFSHIADLALRKFLADLPDLDELAEANARAMATRLLAESGVEAERRGAMDAGSGCDSSFATEPRADGRRKRLRESDEALMALRLRWLAELEHVSTTELAKDEQS